jgi:hypothetical protein
VKPLLQLSWVINYPLKVYLTSFVSDSLIATANYISYYLLQPFSIAATVIMRDLCVKNSCFVQFGLHGLVARYPGFLC